MRSSGKSAPDARRVMDWPVLAAACWCLGCGDSSALDEAIRGDAGRRVSAPSIAARPVEWTPVGGAENHDYRTRRPRALCWLGTSLLVTDAQSGAIQQFDTAGGWIGELPDSLHATSRLGPLATVHCSEDASTVLIADASEGRVTLMSAEGVVRRSLPAPPFPQIKGTLGTFAVASDRKWYDSWLAAPLGPYLTEEGWQTVPLARQWDDSGRLVRQVGRPRYYGDPATTRVFNRTSLALLRDTLWVLTDGAATIQAFDSAGRPGPTIRLPVYQRGRDPMVEIGPEIADGFRMTRVVYEKNVTGLATVGDSLFAVIRFQSYQDAVRGQGMDASKALWPSSSIEIVDRLGRVVDALSAPGQPYALAVSKDGYVAIATDLLEGGAAVLVVSPASYRSRT